MKGPTDGTGPAKTARKSDEKRRLSQLVLEPRGELAETYHLTFGRDGKPFFVAGPYDNAPAIVAKLEATAGPGNYGVMAPLF